MIEELFALIDQIATQNVTDYASRLIGVITPLLGAAVALYMLFKAYEIIWTDRSVPSEAMKTFTSLLIVFSIALGGQYYFDNVVPFVLNSGEDLSNALVGSHGGAASLDKMYNDIYRWADIIWSDADGFEESAQAMIAMGGLELSGFIFIAVSTVYLLVAKVMVAILLVLGPLFISFAFFPSTRSFFQAWTGQCVNYILLTLCFTITFGLFEKIAGQLIIVDTLNYMLVGQSVVLFVIMILVSVQVPTLCSSLSGGVGINGLVGGIASTGAAIGGAAAGLAIGAKKSGGWMAKDVAKDINSVRRAMSNNISKG